MAVTATAREDRDDDGKFHHGCGQSFTYAGAYSKHALKCDGRPKATSRIAGGTGEAPKVVELEPVTAPTRAHATRSRRRPRPVSRPKAREQKRTRVARTGNKIRARSQTRRTSRKRTNAAEVIHATLVEAAISPTQMLAALRDERLKIDNAIAAIEALGR